MQRTLTIVKPDCVRLNLTGAIISCIEKRFHITGMKMLKLSKEEAKRFYIVHNNKTFYNSLTDFMSSGPVVAMVLEGDNIIEEFRRFMGATDPKNAEEGTIRKKFGTNIEENAIHGSDSEEAASFEVNYFFSDLELVR